MTSKKNFSISGLILKIIVAWALVAFVVYPVVSLLIQTFWQDGTLSTEVVSKVFSSARAVKMEWVLVLNSSRSSSRAMASTLSSGMP